MQPVNSAEKHPQLALNNLSAGYEKQLIVDGVSLNITPHKMTVLIGANGCGKSTLLNTIARMQPPMAGCATLDGKVIHQHPTKAIARQLGILPQSPLLPEGVTVTELVARGRFPWQGWLRQWSEQDEQIVAEALELTGLTALATQPVATLSGGQRQRCWIAMALAQCTPIILLDEPTTFLDIRYQVEIMELLHRLTREHQRTVVVVLHDLNFALHYGDVLVFLKQGKLQGVVNEGEECSAELITHVFDTPVQKLVNPVSGKAVFLPFRTTEGQH
ncbi:ABC transporter ATP-binding protein [Pantoea sp. A4]|uniref:ABC transporter ATP-binding protein n=1 Tax=Pantoea sp. A4 TaxID=1225184 RepID=UPI000370F6E5|nr:ABC transporter ATP-binding protein [Pantoea sp. A4]